ncbi:hypothetical protein B0H63DRAFT_464852 [Podospora didyma]|uniref:Uncharacterized protein n=1 Tax=Podospora didyma TaxID=330526 RepID=A0AAE0NYL6_9PEZI|nr:hypothetical protein B0H63DRAFT_464852 [Podospora didyma]
MATAEERLRTLHPRLTAASDDLSAQAEHIGSASTQMFWAQEFIPLQGSTRFIIGLREEALDIYVSCIATELVQADSRVLLSLDNAIRLRLRGLEPQLRYWSSKFKTIPDRGEIEAKAARPQAATSSDNTSTLIAITAVAIFATFVPLGIAWAYRDDSSGTWFDMDFWLLVQNALMQLLGIFMAMRPISVTKDNTTPRKAWHWAIWFAGLGSLCSVASVFLYLYVPRFWSGFASFAATAAQVSMVVQLALLTTSTSFPSSQGHTKQD